MNYKEKSTEFLQERASLLVNEAKYVLEQQKKLDSRISEINKDTKEIVEILMLRKAADNDD